MEARCDHQHWNQIWNESFHGSTYYFNRNSALDARNWFNPAPDTVAALNFHQFGASAGGPILKKQAFYIWEL